MKKRGFTLVELLAVIAILAILVLISLPNVVGMFNNAKKSTFMTEAQSLYKEATNKYIQETMKGNKVSVISSEDDSALELSGNNLKYYIKVNSSGEIVRLIVSNGNYCINTNKSNAIELTSNDITDGECDFDVSDEWYDNCSSSSKKLNCKIISDNIAEADNKTSENVTLSTGIDFKRSSDSVLGKNLSKVLYNQDVSFEYYDSTKVSTYGAKIDKENKYPIKKIAMIIGSSEQETCSGDSLFEGVYTKLDFKDGSYNLSNYNCNTKKSYGEKAVGGYLCIGSTDKTGYAYSNSTMCNNAIRILEVKDGIITKADIYYTERDDPDKNGTGLYYTTDKSVTSKRIYFYRGNVSNNYVVFANHCWRIIRTNEDESIRMIYFGDYTNGSCPDNGVGGFIKTGVKYNDNNSDNRYIGYMYGDSCDTYENCHQNINDSNIKKVVEEWYKENILTLGDTANNIQDTVYCNDRSLIYGSGKENEDSYYNGYGKIRNDSMGVNLNLGCSRNEDKFTVDSAIGNGKLKYPIALIETNDIVLAGALRNYDNYRSYVHSYLYMKDNAYWTMSPYLVNKYNKSAIMTVSGGEASSASASNTFSQGHGYYIVAPVISLKSTVNVQSGSGTKNNPYIVK